MADSFSLDDFIERTGKGVFFSVLFQKRTSPEIRDMLCRRGVKKHLRGGQLGYDAAEKHLLTVFDIRIGEYRSINLDGILSLKIAKKKFNFDSKNKVFNIEKELSNA